MNNGIVIRGLRNFKNEGQETKLYYLLYTELITSQVWIPNEHVIFQNKVDTGEVNRAEL